MTYTDTHTHATAIDGLVETETTTYLRTTCDTDVDTQASYILPQNLLIQADVALETFEDDAEWTAANGSVSDDTTNFKTGSQSVKLTTDSGATATMTKTVNWTGLGAYEFIRVWAYNYNTTLADITSWSIKISSTTDFSKYYSYTVSGSDLKWYWFMYYIPLYLMSSFGGESWSNTMIRVRFTITAATGKTVNISFDDLEAGYPRVPVVLFYTDSADASWFTGGVVDYMRTLGIRATLFMTATKFLGRDAEDMTLANLTQLYTDNWLVASHGYSGNGVSMGTWLTQAEMEYQVGEMQIFIRNYLGLPGGDRYGSYGGGGDIYDAPGTRAALVAAEALIARDGQGYGNPSYYPPGDWYNIPRGPAAVTIISNSVAEIETAIDNAITHGQILIVGGRRSFNGYGGGDMTVDNAVFAAGQSFTITSFTLTAGNV